MLRREFRCCVIIQQGPWLALDNERILPSSSTLCTRTMYLWEAAASFGSVVTRLGSIFRLFQITSLPQGQFYLPEIWVLWEWQHGKSGNDHPVPCGPASIPQKSVTSRRPSTGVPPTPAACDGWCHLGPRCGVPGIPGWMHHEDAQDYKDPHMAPVRGCGKTHPEFCTNIGTVLSELNNGNEQGTQHACQSHSLTCHLVAIFT